MSQKLVSIIVPIYNSAHFLDRCITSLLNQTYENIEILLINDGSKDDSDSICKKYLKNDSRVRYYSKDNEGPGPTRNFGLNVCQGEYISFVDSDDYIELDMINIMVQTMEKNMADVVQVGYSNVNLNGDSLKKVSIVNKKEIIEGSFSISEEFAIKNKINNFLCNKLFTKESIGELRLPNFYAAEDHWLLMNICLKINKIIILPVIMYNYVDNPNSLTRNEFNEKKLDNIKSGEEMYKIMNSNYEILAPYYALFIASFCAITYSQLDKKHHSTSKMLLEKFKFYYSLSKNSEAIERVSKKRRYMIKLFDFNFKIGSKIIALFL